MSPIRLSLLAATLLLGVPAYACAQAPAAVPSAMDAMRASFAEVSGWIVRAGESVSEAQYGYRPAAGVRSFGEMIGHVADGNNYYCGRAAGNDPPWEETVARSGAGKDELLARLRESIERCAAAHDAGNAARGTELLANYGHASLHYGNLVTYLRMLGVTPPSSG